MNDREVRREKERALLRPELEYGFMFLDQIVNGLSHDCEIIVPFITVISNVLFNNIQEAKTS